MHFLLSLHSNKAISNRQCMKIKSLTRSHNPTILTTRLDALPRISLFAVTRFYLCYECACPTIRLPISGNQIAMFTRRLRMHPTDSIIIP